MEHHTVQLAQSFLFPSSSHDTFTNKFPSSNHSHITIVTPNTRMKRDTPVLERDGGCGSILLHSGKLLSCAAHPQLSVTLLYERLR
jgi:hypothetical protein